MMHSNHSSQKSKKSTTMFLMLLGNVVVLIGVLFFKWEPFLIIFLYWFENIIVGFYNILKMIISKPSIENKNYPLQDTPTNPIVLKFFLIPFFIIHYGGFTLVHGVFVFVLFGHFMKETLTPKYLLIDSGIYFAIITLFISHGILFFVKFIKNDDYKKITLPKLMFTPYKRIIILHLTIIISAFFVFTLKNPILASIILVGLKILAEITNAFTIKEESSTMKYSEYSAKKNNNDDGEIVFTFDDPGEEDDSLNDD